MSTSVHARIHPPCLPQCMLGYTARQTPPGQRPPGQRPPCPVHAGIDMATVAVRSHSTGMHSCLDFYLAISKLAPNALMIITKQYAFYRGTALRNDTCKIYTDVNK